MLTNASRFVLMFWYILGLAVAAFMWQSHTLGILLGLCAGAAALAEWFFNRQARADQ